MAPVPYTGQTEKNTRERGSKLDTGETSEGAVPRSNECVPSIPTHSRLCGSSFKAFFDFFFLFSLPLIQTSIKIHNAFSVFP